jgi:hypothetical protein
VLVNAFATPSLTELHLRETGHELKCMHPLRNHFGSFAVIAAVLLRSTEAGSYSAAPPPSASTVPEPCPRIHEGLGETIGERVVVAEACRDPQPPPGGRRHLHWQIVRAHSVIGPAPSSISPVAIRMAWTAFTDHVCGALLAFSASGHHAPFLTISKPLAANSRSMALATCELCSGRMHW